MSLDLLNEMLEPLPYSLRDQIEGYALAIDELAEGIFDEARIAFDEELLDQLVFMVGVRRLWTITNSNYSILNNSLSLMARHDVDGFAVGSHVLSMESAEFTELRRLRDDLLQRFRELGLERYVLARSVREILVMLREAQDEPQ